MNCWGFEREAAVPAGLASVAAISADFRHSCALKTDGSVTCWGSNFRGETTVPAGLAGVAAISAGAFHTCALKTDGSVSCWGDDPSGAANVVPTGLAGVAAVSAGAHHTCALKTDGSVICWGDNGAGQTSVPAGLNGVAAVSAGFDYTCALKTDASVSCWGDNGAGQTTVPTGLADVVAVTAGFLHTCALKTDGSVSCWGDNRLGQTTVPVGLDLITEPAETPTGSNVLVQPVDPATGASPATLTFSSVTAPGQTTISHSETGAPPPTGFKLGTPPTYYEIATTAAFTGSVEVCIRYAPASFEHPAQLKLFHDGGSGWEDVTTTNDPTTGQICGNVSSLSPFALFERAKQPQVITFGVGSLTKTLGDADFSVAALASGGGSGNPVTFATTTPAVCSTTSVGTVHLAGQAGECTIRASQAGNESYLPASDVEQTIPVLYRFSGFFQPVYNAELNTVKAGRAIPLKFSLSGNQGLGIIQAGSPSSSVLSCGTAAAGDPIEDPVTTNSGLSYDPVNDQYTYVWKTNSAWTGCRRLTLTLTDGTRHEARFYFAK